MNKRTENAQKFISVWQQSNNIREVAAKLSMSIESCRMRAMTYRKKGVPLKKLARSKRIVTKDMPKLDYASLAKFAERFVQDEAAS